MDTYTNTDLITDCVIFSLSILGMCLTVFGIWSLIKTHHAAVYVINLFISDLIQTSVRIIQISRRLVFLKISKFYKDEFDKKASVVYIAAVAVNIFFMVCISAERYVMIAHPVWYRNLNKIRTSVLVSVTIWIVLFVLTIMFFLTNHLHVGALLAVNFPYPFVVFFFVGTRRALCGNTTLNSNEQRRIMVTLGLVLFIYTVLFLPTVFGWLHFLPHLSSGTFRYFSNILWALNPLFDFVLYLIVRRDAKTILSALFCCFNERDKDNTIASTVTEARV